MLTKFNTIRFQTIEINLDPKYEFGVRVRAPFISRMGRDTSHKSAYTIKYRNLNLRVGGRITYFGKGS